MQQAARFSLSFLWIFTGLTSSFFAQDIGYEGLSKGGITGPSASACILAGSLVDIALGLWLLLGWRLRTCYQIQITVIVIYTLLLTVVDPSFWLHPFGPLTKNIPILVLILMISESEK